MAKSKPVLVELTADQQVMLGFIRMSLGDNGNPVSASRAVRLAIEYLAQYLRTEPAQPSPHQAEIAK